VLKLIPICFKCSKIKVLKKSIDEFHGNTVNRIYNVKIIVINIVILFQLNVLKNIKCKYTSILIIQILYGDYTGIPTRTRQSYMAMYKGRPSMKGF